LSVNSSVLICSAVSEVPAPPPPGEEDAVGLVDGLLDVVTNGELVVAAALVLAVDEATDVPAADGAMLPELLQAAIARTPAVRTAMETPLFAARMANLISVSDDGARPLARC
jgi:hypothetical protein